MAYGITLLVVVLISFLTYWFVEYICKHEFSRMIFIDEKSQKRYQVCTKCAKKRYVKA